MPVHNRMAVNDTPHVRELERIVDEYERFAVLLADRQRARLFVFELGELVDESEHFDQLPRHDDDKGDWEKDHVRDHAAALAHQHLRRAAQVAFDVYQNAGFDHLIIGAPDEIARELEHELHSYLRERIAARVSVPVNAREDEIRQAALEVEATGRAAARRRPQSNGCAMRSVRATAGSPGSIRCCARSSSGGWRCCSCPTGSRQPGWRCRSCGYVGVKGGRCPVCSNAMEQVDDVVEEAVEEALAQSCRVETCRDNADLDVLGRIGALLRY